MQINPMFPNAMKINPVTPPAISGAGWGTYIRIPSSLGLIKIADTFYKIPEAYQRCACYDTGGGLCACGGVDFSSEDAQEGWSCPDNPPLHTRCVTLETATAEEISQLESKQEQSKVNWLLAEQEKLDKSTRGLYIWGGIGIGLIILTGVMAVFYPKIKEKIKW